MNDSDRVKYDVLFAALDLWDSQLFAHTAADRAVSTAYREIVGKEPKTGPVIEDEYNWPAA